MNVLNCDNKKAKILLLKFACNADLGPKKIGCMIMNDIFGLQSWPSKVQIILAALFSENSAKACS